MKHLVYLDIMKFWGVFFVVLGHVTNFYVDDPLIRTLMTADSLKYVSSFIYSFHMPLFVFVSGSVYAFQYVILGKRNSFITLVKKKSSRLLIPYLFFGVIMTLLMVGLGLRDSLVDYAYQGFILSKDSRHLWFVLMLFEVFIIFFVFSKIAEYLKLPNYVTLIVSFVCYLFANKVPYLFQISSALKYIFWFSLGYSFILYKQKIHKLIVCYLAGGVILLFSLFLRNGIAIRIPFIETITSMVGIMFIFQFSYDFQHIIRCKLFHIICKDAMGIYLYHVFFIYLLFYLLRDYRINPYILTSSIFCISILLSILLTEITRKIGLGFIIGESI